MNQIETLECNGLKWGDNVWKVQTVLEDAGIIFIDKNGVRGVGVRLKE